MVSFTKIALSFLRLGSIGFGGPLALVALMEQEFVHRQKWVDRKRFEETFVFCKMLPGPLAYQMALWIGTELRGKIGGVVAGAAFVLPAATLLFLFAKFYSLFEVISSAEWVLDGMRAGALVVILQSVGSLFSPYRKKATAWFYALFGAVLMLFLPRWEPLIIVTGGILSSVLIRSHPGFRLRMPSLPLLLTLYWVHFKAGALVFGTGLAIIPVLEREVVGVYHWLNRQEFLDAFAFGQVTPGPVTTVAAFVGYKAGGDLGSLVSTLGMYSPGALMILFFLPGLRKRIEGKSWLIDFQLGAVPTVIGCLAAAAWGLMGASLKTPQQRVGVAILLLFQIAKKLPAWMVIMTGVVLGFLMNVVFASILS